METPRLAQRMGAVLEDEACHEDISIGIGRGNVLITNTRVPYKVYNSVPLVLYLKPFHTTGCTN